MRLAVVQFVSNCISSIRVLFKLYSIHQNTAQSSIAAVKSAPLVWTSTN